MLVIGRSYGFSIQVDETIGAAAVAMTKLAEETTEYLDKVPERVTAGITAGLEIGEETTGSEIGEVTTGTETGTETAGTKLMAYRGANAV